MGDGLGLAGFPEIVLFRYRDSRCSGYPKRCSKPDRGRPTRPCAAQCRLATELHLGEGRLGIKPDIHKAAAWYREAAKNGDPIALQSLVVLKATHPDTIMQESDVY